MTVKLVLLNNLYTYENCSQSFTSVIAALLSMNKCYSNLELFYIFPLKIYQGLTVLYYIKQYVLYLNKGSNYCIIYAINVLIDSVSF